MGWRGTPCGTTYPHRSSYPLARSLLRDSSLSGIPLPPAAIVHPNIAGEERIVTMAINMIGRRMPRLSLYLNPSPPLALPHPSRSSVRSVVVAPHSTSSSPRTPHLATVFVGSTLLPDSVLSIIPIIPSRVHPSSWRALEDAACQTVGGVDLSLFSQQRTVYERRIQSGLSGYGSTSLKCSSFFLE